MDTAKQNITPIVSFAAMAVAMYGLQYLSKAQEAKRNELKSHLGIETGGTSCKVCVMKDVDGLS